jgi:WD repeat-containing protein 23
MRSCNLTHTLHPPLANMSAPGSSQDMQSEEDDPRTIFYDPNDPFWQDTEDDHDDMEYVPAPGDSEEEDGLNFHGAHPKAVS